MAKKPLSFNQKLTIFFGAMFALMIVSVVAIVVISKQGVAGKIFSHFYRDYAGMKEDQDNRAKLAEAESLIKKNQKSGEGYARRAECYSAQDDDELALKDYDRAISLEPTRAEWYYKRGHVRSRENLEDKIKDFSKAIELKPQKQYYFDRAEAYAESEQNDEALSDFDKALEMGYPAAIVHERRGEAYIAGRQLNQAVDAFKKSIASRGDEALDGDEWETVYSQNKSHRKLANLYAALGDFGNALSQASAWIKKDPEDDEAYLLRARFHRALGDMEKAKVDQEAGIARITKQIADYPSGYLYKERAAAYKESGKVDDARADLRKAIDCYKKEIVEEGLAKDYYKSEIESLEEEISGERTASYERDIKEYTSKIAAKPKDAELYSERASLYEKAKQLPLALRDYETGMKLCPTDTSFGLNIGRLLINQKKYTQAAAEYAKLTRTEDEKNNYWVYTKMAQALELAGSHDEAIKAADKSIELEPLSGDGYYWRSKALESKGDKEQAKASMSQAIALEFDLQDYE